MKFVEVTVTGAEKVFAVTRDISVSKVKGASEGGQCN
jgi:hypothetical protein